MPSPIEQYHNRHNEAKNYDQHMFIAGRVLQAAELNELQSASQARLRHVTDILFKDGDLIRDAGIIVNKDTGATICESGAIYVDGAVRGVVPRTITIPILGTILVGVYKRVSVVSELEDPTLRDPATGLRNYQQPGALRRQIELVWGYDGDGEAGEFYPVYVVENGIVRSKEAPPELDAFTQSLAKYDRDSAGGKYVVNGLTIAKADDISGNQIYTVTEGRARVNGFNVEKSAGQRLVYPATPDLRFIDSEQHVSTSDTAMRVDLDYLPISNITAVHITRQKSADMIHGTFTDAQDPLPDTSIVSIIAVNQGGTVNGAGTAFIGGTTYVQGTDYKLTAGKIDWSLGGAEIAPNSSYKVIYRAIVTAEPTGVDATGFTVADAVVGTQVQVDYNQKLARIDKLVMDVDGTFTFVQGVSSPYNPQPPTVSDNVLSLATIVQTWDDDRRVINDGVRVVPMSEIAAINGKLDRLMDLVAQERLKSDASVRDIAAKKSVFVDPFINDDLRDMGITQDAAIVNGTLSLPISATVLQAAADVAIPTTLAYTLSPIIEQPLRTGSMKVNPYMSFAPIPALVVLTPAVDRWTRTIEQVTGSITRRFSTGQGTQSTVTSSTSLEFSGVTSSAIIDEKLRPIKVAFTVAGFGPMENLTTVMFDGIFVPFTAPT